MGIENVSLALKKAKEEFFRENTHLEVTSLNVLRIIIIII